MTTFWDIRHINLVLESTSSHFLFVLTLSVKKKKPKKGNFSGVR